MTSKLAAWRTTKGLTLRDLEGLSGFTTGYLSQVERGLRRMSPEAKVRLARAVGAEVHDLFEPEPMPPQPPMRSATGRSAPVVQHGDGPLTITVPEAGRLLGIGRDAAYRAAERGEIPTLKLGRRIVVPVPKLMALLS